MSNSNLARVGSSFDDFLHEAGIYEEVEAAALAHIQEYTGGQPLDQSPAAVYLSNLRSYKSRRTMLQALNTIAEMLKHGDTAFTLPWHELKYQHTTAVRTQLIEQYKPATANKMMAALRGVLKEAWRLRLMTAEAYEQAADIKNVKNDVLPKGRALEDEEISSLLISCDSSPAGLRDTALILVMFGCGPRRSEVVALDLADYNARTGAITIRGGKGSKDRIVYAQEDVAEAIEDWLEVRFNPPGALFCPVTLKGEVVIRRMTDQAVMKILQKRAKLAEVEAFSPHDLRRTFISNLLDAGADISAVKGLAGHSDVNTTARYDRRGENAKKKAANLLKIPKKRK